MFSVELVWLGTVTVHTPVTGHAIDRTNGTPTAAYLAGDDVQDTGNDGCGAVVIPLIPVIDNSSACNRKCFIEMLFSHFCTIYIAFYRSTNICGFVHISALIDRNRNKQIRRIVVQEKLTFK